jgi:hypothetical protein
VKLNSARLYDPNQPSSAPSYRLPTRRTLYFVTGAALAAAFVWSVLG